MLEGEVKKRIELYKSYEKNEDFLKELDNLLKENDEDSLYERFYQDLAFGTAGLRGAIGAGTNRMNSFVVSRTTQGIANYLIKTYPEKAKKGELKAVIAYDSRHYSPLFAKTASLIFAANGIHAFLFSSMRATPELSFAIRHLKTDTGIVITASHNPPEYNGYKAYWNDGVQITAPHDEGITEEVEKVSDIEYIEEKQAKTKNLLTIIDKEIDVPYFTSVLQMVEIGETKVIEEAKKDLKIVYTPLHGVGYYPVEHVLSKVGFNIFTVPEQREGDGSFPTVSYPNPEDAKALKLALDYANKMDADIVMATDPDADRFAAGVRDESGEIKLLTGNQIGVLFFDYLCQTKLKMTKSPLIIRSIVTSHMVDKIAKANGILLKECLTGFKWICGLARQIEKEGKDTYVFGFEESFGYNFAGDVGDKDGIAASLLFAQLSSYYKSKGSSVLERLDELFTQYGVFTEFTINKTYKGSSGISIMKGIMEKVRLSSLKELSGVSVLKVRDVLEGIERSSDGKKTCKISLPKSNVLQYFLADGSVISLRPSGTEPKIKAYIIAYEKVDNSLEISKERAQTKLKDYESFLQNLIGE